MKHKKTQRIFTVLAAVLAVFALGACSSGIDYTPNDPSAGTMNGDTARSIFNYETTNDGIVITGLKSANKAAAYELSRAATVNLDSVTLPKYIDNIPVVGIDDSAFSPRIPGNDDISRVTNVFKLPDTIKTLGSGLFDGVAKLITLEIPPAVATEVGNSVIIAAIGSGALANVGGSVITPSPSNLPVFARPSSPAVYTLAYYEGTSGKASLKKGDSSSAWYRVTDTNLKALFNAIYEPNKPGSADAVESGKSAIPYNASISAAALDLFKITIGASSSADTVELKGTNLPIAAGASASNLIVIDIGIPNANNSLKVYIPKDKTDTLGDAAYTGGDYSRIRLRVNNGAELVILADNYDYITNSGTGYPCPEGNFKGGAVEVRAGGKLRDGAYEGFPLGAGAVLVNRTGSYLSIGPEPGSSDAAAISSVYNAYYAGYLLGPSGNGARVEWDSTNTTDKYLEVRAGQIITNAQLTVKVNMGLIYSIWFLPGAALDINITSGVTGDGLFANEKLGVADYNFYVVQPSGSNFMTVTSGILDKRFLITGGVDFDPLSHVISSTSLGGSYNSSVTAQYASYIGYLITP
jgi:hypothetical protein